MTGLFVILEERSDDRIFNNRFFRISAESANSLQNDIAKATYHYLLNSFRQILKPFDYFDR